MNNLHVVVGLGATGFSCVRYLHQQGIPVAVTDSRENPPHLAAIAKDFPDVQTSLGQLDSSLLKQAAVIVVSPGLATDHAVFTEARARGVPIIGDIELFARAVNKPIVGITGTNAKSTVTTLVGLMAEAAGIKTAVGGNIGVPALDLLQSAADLYVLELSSFQLETSYHLPLAVATILNIAPDHLDRYPTVAEYTLAKQRIYQHCKIAVANRDDRATWLNDQRIVEQRFFTMQVPGPGEFGIEIGDGERYLSYQGESLLNVRELPVLGRHYQANALAALAIGHALALPMTAMLQTLKTFQGLPHRCQWVGEWHGVRWYNDSKGTNVGATLAAMQGLGSEIPGKLILIAGGVGKNADFSPLLPVLMQYVRHLILLGEAAAEIAALVGERLPMSRASSMAEAVAMAKVYSQAGDSVLLSPACASYDMFKHFEHRGEVFIQLVKELY